MNTVNIYTKSIIVGVVVLVVALLVPISTVPQAPDAAQHEYPSAETFGLKEYGFPFRMYWKYGYASYKDLLTEEMALDRGGEIYWWAIIVNFLIYSLIAFVIFRLVGGTKRRP
jgi:hypothetical protein